MEFRPSEIAAAVAISISRQIQEVDIDKAMSCFKHVEKVKLVVPTEINPGQDNLLLLVKRFCLLYLFQFDELMRNLVYVWDFAGKGGEDS